MNDADETSVEYGSSVIKKEMDLAEGDSSSTDQEQACFEQMDELISVVGGDWRILAACLELSAEKIQYFEHEDLQTEQIFVEIMRSHKVSLFFLSLLCSIDSLHHIRTIVLIIIDLYRISYTP